MNPTFVPRATAVGLMRQGVEIVTAAHNVITQPLANPIATDFDRSLLDWVSPKTIGATGPQEAAYAKTQIQMKAMRQQAEAVLFGSLEK